MTGPLTSKAARLAALGLDEDDVCMDGTVRGVGVCRSCNRRVALVRLMYCPLCGSNRGVAEGA